MLHTDLDIPLHAAARARRPIIQQADFPPRNNLLQPPVDRVAHLHEASPLVHQDEIHAAPEHRLPGLADELHNDRAGDVAELVDVDTDLFETEQELGVAEAEHAQGPLIAQPHRDAGAIRGLEVRDAEGHLLVQGHDLDALCRRDRDAGVEEVDGVSLGRDVEVVEIAEELGDALAHAQ